MRDEAAPSTDGDAARGAEASARRAVVAVWRIESARIVATLTRYTGDFALAEDLAQDALADALVRWPTRGVPRNGAAWLTTVAKRKAIDAWRRQKRLTERVEVLGLQLEREQDRAMDALPWDPDEIDDDVLRLVFTACHPVLSEHARVALTLRVVAGLETTEIARLFLVPVATIQQRIVRAKQALADAGVPFEAPPRAERQQRLGAVLGVIYLIFTEVHALLALLELSAARFPARLDARGQPVLLSDQDRRRWDRAAIRRGRAALARAEGFGRGLGPYGLQAVIAEAHAAASDIDATDWSRIVAAYEGLERIAPSPVVTLNRAVAISMADGPGAGPAAALAIVDGLAGERSLATGHLLPSVRGELLARLGRDGEAREAFALAAERAQNARERAVLLAKAAAGR